MTFLSQDDEFERFYSRNSGTKFTAYTLSVCRLWLQWSRGNVINSEEINMADLRPLYHIVDDVNFWQ